MTLVATDERKITMKKHKELWNKIRDLIRSITNNSDNYDEKSVKKMLELYNMVIFVRSVLHESTRFLRWMFVQIVNAKMWLDWC